MSTKRDYLNQGRPLTPMLSRIILTAEEENRHVLRVSDFKKFYQTTDNNARAMIAHLVDTGWLIRLGRGCYQLQSAKTGLEPYPTGDKFVLAGQFAPDSFIAYGSAAEYHGLTTQIFQNVLLATPRRRNQMSQPELKLRFILIDSENYVGFQKTTKAPDVKVATIERTIIDAIDRPDLCGGISDLKEILNRARGKASIQRILEYLPTYHSKSLIQRVGYLLESEGFGLKPAEKKRLLSWCHGNKTYLFSRKQAGTTKLQHYSKDWQLVINAPGFSPIPHQRD
ncbi:MAG: type IV toxin-antitoxin system AbiEi family antitoxin domain-containing protein [Candidatus Obscuribacterales bacterium]|nr:type IV toxin-antitoxin system AbiEi family antitoxin domain-containing protein [Candidatus Obscuribacterales bacterium]